MTQPTTVTVPPDFPKQLATLVAANLALAGGIYVAVGWGMIQTGVCTLAVGLSTVCLVAGAVRQRPRVVITPEGFVVLPAFAGRTHPWEDIDGPFAVIQIGMSKAVAYKLTADYKARVGKKPPSRFSGHQGYDEVIIGNFRLSAEELASALNEHKRRRLPSGLEEPRGVAPAQPSAAAHPAPAQEAQAVGSGSPILRVAAGVLALLFAGFGAVGSNRTLGGWVFMEAFALLFGWYAVRGRKGLPRFLTKKLSAHFAPPFSMKKNLISVIGVIAVVFLFWYLQGGPEKIRKQKTAERLSAAAKAVDPQEQIRLYTSAIESDPTCAVAYYNRGLICLAKAENDKAIADFTKTMELNPQYAEAYCNRGIAYDEKGDPGKAIPD